MDGAYHPRPEDLGRVESIDSFAVEPGVILLERFCALSAVERHHRGWWVPITDLSRRLGAPPHHRLRLEFMRADLELERKLRRAVNRAPGIQARVHAWLSDREGVLLLTEPCAAPPIATPLTEEEALAVATALASALSQLHEEEITGISFTPENIHFLDPEVTVVGNDHLLATGTAEEDVHRLVELLDLLSGGSLSPLLKPAPSTAIELWDRVRGLQASRSAPEGSLVLPSTPPFVGRSELLTRLMEAVRRARRGEAQVVVVRGDAGSGKTRLLHRYALEVERWMDVLVLTGSFRQGEPPVRVGFLEALDGLANAPSSLSIGEHRAIRQRVVDRTGDLVGLIAGLSPMLHEYLGEQVQPPEINLDEKFFRHASTIATAIRAIGCRDRPLVVLVDDMHLADRASRAILGEMVRGSPDHHTLVVVTAAAASADDLAEGASAVLQLDPLNRTETRELLERCVPGTLVDAHEHGERLWRESQGRPVAIWATLQSWTHRGLFAMRDPDGTWGLRADRTTSTAVVDLYARQWTSLQPHQQWLLVIAALRAGRATVQWLVEVTTWTRNEVENAIQAACDAGLLVHDPDGGIRFSNNAVREVVESSATEEIRKNAHKQIAAWLGSKPGASAAQRAWHLEHARHSGRDERLSELHVQGGKELLAIYDLRRARWHFDRALAHTNTPRVRVEGLEGLADVALLEGRVEQALHDYLEAMTVGDDALRGLEIAARAVWGFYRKSAPDAAFTLADAALRMAGEPLPTSRPGMWFALFRALVSLLFSGSRTSTRVREALCRVHGTVAATFVAEQPLVMLLSVLRGYRHAQGLDSPDAASMIALFATARGAIGHRRAADRLLRQAEGVARRAGHPWGLGIVHHLQAQHQLSLGNYAEGGTLLDAAIEQFRKAGDTSVAVWSLTFRATYGRDSHHLQQTLAWLQEAEAIGERQGNTLGVLVHASLRAYLLARLGRREVLDDVIALSERALGLTTLSTEMVNVHAYLSLAFSALGDAERARVHAYTAVDRLDSTPAAAEYHYDARIAAAAAVLATRNPGPRDRRALHRALKALKARGRNWPRLMAAYRFFKAQEQVQLGRVAKARLLLNELIAQLPGHGQLYYAYRAHLALADLTRGEDVLVASRHEEEARALAIDLGFEEEPRQKSAPPAPKQTALTPIETVVGDRGPQVSVEGLVNRLRPAFERALPIHVPLHISVAEGARVSTNPESLQLLIVNMVLAARDALSDTGEIHLTVSTVSLDQKDSARLPGANIDVHLLIEVRAVGFNGSETISGLGMCCEITTGIGGFVDVRQEGKNVLVIGAYLAIGTTPSPVEVPPVASVHTHAVVFHLDARIRQTVVSALRDMGVMAEGLDPRLQLHRPIGPDKFVFADPDVLAELPHLEAYHRAVLLIDRSRPVPAEGYAIRVPFTIGELQKVVDAVMRRDSTDTA